MKLSRYVSLLQSKVLAGFRSAFALLYAPSP